MKTKSILTIARQYGSGGREIGRKLASELDIPFYDKELIAMAAKQSGMSMEIIKNADEKAANSLLYALMMGNFSLSGGIPTINNEPINDKLFLLQSKIIREIASKGPCVIVGRCADDILNDRKDIFKVYVFSEKLARMDRIVKEYGVKSESGAKTLIHMDKQRSTYYHFYTGKNWGDRSNYHLCINSSIYGIDGAVSLILQALKIKDAHGGF